MGLGIISGRHYLSSYESCFMYSFGCVLVPYVNSTHIEWLILFWLHDAFKQIKRHMLLFFAAHFTCLCICVLRYASLASPKYLSVYLYFKFPFVVPMSLASCNSCELWFRIWCFGIILHILLDGAEFVNFKKNLCRMIELGASWIKFHRIFWWISARKM